MGVCGAFFCCLIWVWFRAALFCVACLADFGLVCFTFTVCLFEFAMVAVVLVALYLWWRCCFGAYCCRLVCYWYVFIVNSVVHDALHIHCLLGLLYCDWLDYIGWFCCLVGFG